MVRARFATLIPWSLGICLPIACSVDDRVLRPGTDPVAGSGGRSSGGVFTSNGGSIAGAGSPGGGTSAASAGNSSTAGRDGSTEGGSPPGGSGPCPVGVSVLLSDGVSTQIATSDLSGTTQSESFLSTASTMVEGLSFALSGDVVLPSARTESNRLVALDRLGANAITFADASDAHVIAQLAVGTGFDSQPSDYLELDGDRAFVTRFGDNPDPGRLAFDRGGDVLVLDTRRFDITRSIDLPRDGDLAPSPVGMTRVGDRVWIALDRRSLASPEIGEATLVGVSIESERVEFELALEGVEGCGRPALSPSGELVAIACAGASFAAGDVVDTSQSALLLLDPSRTPPREIRRFAAEDLALAAIQADVVFASESVALLKTQDTRGKATNNRWLALDLEAELTSVLVEASSGADGESQGNVYGAMSCAPGCSELCLLADADADVLQRVRVTPNGDVELIEPVSVTRSGSLKPRQIAPR